MIELKCLHVGSFDGNIGDNANHNGFYRLLKKHHPTISFRIDQWEIREVFWGRKRFDSEFVKEANNYDLIIIGGGNFFELWVEKSCNSTSVDISIENLRRIKTPVLFNALGVDPHQGIANESAFREWISFVTAKPEQYLLSVRNDGAIGNLIKTFGENFAQNFHPVPDGGFFMNVDSGTCLPTGKKYIGVNLAGDMLEGRFSKSVSPEGFIEKFADLMKSVLEKYRDYEFLFFAHIYRDVELINRILASLPDQFIRKNIQIAPYMHGQGSEEIFFKYYRQCDLIWANRFHSNVCAINLGVPVIGLLNYPQIENLYSELGAKDLLVDLRQDGFETKLKEKTFEQLTNSKEAKDRLNDIGKGVERQAADFHKKIAEWLPRG